MPSLVAWVRSMHLRQYRTRLRFVASHLYGQRFGALESLLVAQLPDELDVESPAIEIGIEIEQVRLEQQLASAQRRPRAEARDARQPACTGARDANREDAVDRAHLAAERHVRGRIAKRAPETLSANDA